jgi:lysophospholipase L1-like esterase
MRVLISVGLTCFFGFVQAATGDAIFVVGDSITLQSADGLEAAMAGHSVVVHDTNGRDTFHTAANIQAWMEAASSEEFDVVRWNNGIWDAQPLAGIGGIVTTDAEFEANIRSIVNEIRSHSANAEIIYSTSPVIDDNRLTLDPPPATGLLDIDDYNASLRSYRDIALAVLPGLGVHVDDKFAFYRDNAPSGFGLLPEHENTGTYWHWDGVHFDKAYRDFEGQQTAAAILSVIPVPEPSPALCLGLVGLACGWIQRWRAA